MEFKIRKLGEDNNDDSNNPPSAEEINNLASSNPQEPVITPTGEKSKLQLKGRNSSSGPKLQLREEHQYGSKSAADEALGGLKCTNCGAEIEPEAIICVGCGFNIKSGKNLKTKVSKSKIAQKTGPAKASSSKKKSSVFNLANVVILLVLLGIGFQFLIRPALYKAREKAIAAKCKVRIKSIMTAISLGVENSTRKFCNAPRTLSTIFTKPETEM